MKRKLRKATHVCIFNFGQWIVMTGEALGASVTAVSDVFQTPRAKKKTPAELAEQQEQPWYVRVFGKLD